MRERAAAAAAAETAQAAQAAEAAAVMSQLVMHANFVLQSTNREQKKLNQSSSDGISILNHNSNLFTCTLHFYKLYLHIFS